MNNRTHHHHVSYAQKASWPCCPDWNQKGAISLPCSPWIYQKNIIPFPLFYVSLPHQVGSFTHQNNSLTTRAVKFSLQNQYKPRFQFNKQNTQWVSYLAQQLNNSQIQQTWSTIWVLSFTWRKADYKPKEWGANPANKVTDMKEH